MEQDIRLPMAEDVPFIEINEQNPMYALAQRIVKNPYLWVDHDIILLPKRKFGGKTYFQAIRLNSERNVKIPLDKAEVGLNHNLLYSPTKQKFFENTGENLTMIKEDIHQFFVDKVVKNKRWRIKYVNDLQNSSERYKENLLKKISKWLKDSQSTTQYFDNKNIFTVNTLYPNFMMNPPYIDPKKSNLDFFKKVLDKVVREKNDKKYFTVRINGVHYTLNRKTIKRLLKFFRDNQDISQAQTGSDAELEQQFLTDNFDLDFSLSWHNKAGVKDHSGAFFKYFNKTDIDLRKFQIYKRDDPEKNNDQCLIYALKQSGKYSEEFINNCKLKVKNKILHRNDLKELIKNEEWGVDLMEERDDGIREHQARTTTFKGTTDKTVKIGLLDGHYFLIDEVEITSYALLHYTEFKFRQEQGEKNFIKPFNDIRRMRNEKTPAREKRWINSYEAIKIMLELGEELLEKMDYDDLCRTEFLPDEMEIKELSFDNDEFTKPKGGNYGNDKYYKKLDEEFEKERKKKLNLPSDVDIFCFDTETDTNHKVIRKDKDGKDKELLVHDKYLCCYSKVEDLIYDGDDLVEIKKKSVAQENPVYCVLNMLKDIKKPEAILIAHNANYDYIYLLDHLICDNPILKGQRLISGTWKFYNYETKQFHKIRILDSFHMISMGLDKFGKTFGISQEKEVMPYSIYTEENRKKQFIPVNEVLDKKNWLKYSSDYSYKKATDQFLENCRKIQCIINDKIDIIKYASFYCVRDCEVLAEGYFTFRDWMYKITTLDILDFSTLPSVVDAYLVKRGCYDGCYQLAGVCREFIQNSIIGGRCMTKRNKRLKITEKQIADFDAVSLYPSAMTRMNGFLMGKPKVLIDYDFETINKYDGYFIDIRILKVGRTSDFPLITFKNEDGLREWVDTIKPDKIFTVCKTTLNDLIKFHKIEFEIIRGYYFDEGLNPRVKKIITSLFEERKQKKAEKNPIQEVYKMCMNSAYGKSIMKPIEQDTIIKRSEQDAKNYVLKNFYKVDYFYPVGSTDKWAVKTTRPVSLHFSSPHVGSEILAVSKSIMSEVMFLADDLGINIYYTDTDSMHIDYDKIDLLSCEFKEKYGRNLIGSEMGQFHCDFDGIKLLNNSTNKTEEISMLYSKQLIALGKKAYVDEVVGFYENETEKTVNFTNENLAPVYLTNGCVSDGKNDYVEILTGGSFEVGPKEKIEIHGSHVRLKGVSNKCIFYTVKTEKFKSVFDLYNHLYLNDTIHFDLGCKGENVLFKNDKFEYFTIKELTRKIQFENIPWEITPPIDSVYHSIEVI